MKKAPLVTLCIVLMFGLRISQAKNQQLALPNQQDSTSQLAKVTFIELGSVRCIPCRAMQPIMHDVQQKYGSQIKIIFYDVWKDEQKHYAQEYGIRLIPTQVFFDSTGKEIGRHEGLYPLDEMVEFLESQGLEPVNNE
ncbi:thioredoxin family protein [Candidatus Neomarinimicrobiota bacterium]